VQKHIFTLLININGKKRIISDIFFQKIFFRHLFMLADHISRGWKNADRYLILPEIICTFQMIPIMRQTFFSVTSVEKNLMRDFFNAEVTVSLFSF